MTVKILISCVGKDPKGDGRPYAYSMDKIVNVPDHIAFDLIKYGIAQPDNSTPTAEAVVQEV